ncbi:ethanolamine ammonia-lyase small subunit [Sporomusaceae bacterium BoRhaA]|uniref:ethanolamine ammonia-lyase subunit EutC n=1 Tax=Pelorhabdus rhamnosifermentans TaxID=2772457 RepID=UPI001C062593|nr:ethanolamine ammonia-lyase subunit EutC [Pelorhabdus rhamnosifermentans]MBU2701274.1 ethanolamine ammonia-lyase small subunit [Pelorhabdus rhamnosifermentans]
MEELVRDISLPEIKEKVLVNEPVSMESCQRLKKTTNARICVGRSGERFRTETLLKFRADHAIAMDTVWSHVDESIIDRLGFYKVQTMVKDKEEYIRRPDLGRVFSPETMESIKKNCIKKPDVQIIAADGLSAYAINANLEDIYSIMVDGLQEKGYTLGTPIFVKYSRVATMDKISEALGAKVTIQFIGERPGLATGESMSVYMAYEASSLKPESQRTIVSNIYKEGIPPVEAGAQVIYLTDVLMREKKSGVELKL